MPARFIRPRALTPPPASYLSTVLSDNPTILWELAEASGTTAADASGNGNTGTYNGSPTYGQTGPITGYTAVLINSSTDFVKTTPTFNLNGISATLEVWVKRASAPASNMSLMGIKDNTGSQTEFGLDLDTSGHAFAYGFDTTQHSVTGSVNVCDGSWHYLAATWGNNDHLTLYVDGAGDGTPVVVGSVENVANPFYVGGQGFEGISAAGVTFGWAALYSAALSSSRVAAHYAAR